MIHSAIFVLSKIILIVLKYWVYLIIDFNTYLHLFIMKLLVYGMFKLLKLIYNVLNLHNGDNNNQYN